MTVVAQQQKMILVAEKKEGEIIELHTLESNFTIFLCLIMQGPLTKNKLVKH